MPKTITLKFKNGQVKIEAEGFKGSSCSEATEFLKSLGDVTGFEKKAEWFEENLELTGAVNTNYCG